MQITILAYSSSKYYYHQCISTYNVLPIVLTPLYSHHSSALERDNVFVGMALSPTEMEMVIVMEMERGMNSVELLLNLRHQVIELLNRNASKGQCGTAVFLSADSDGSRCLLAFNHRCSR